MDVLEEIKRIPELTFVLLCACTNPDQERCTRIKSIANSSLDWDLVYDVSLHHRVFPLLYKNIKENLPDSVPDRIVEKLKKNYVNNATKNLYFSGFLIKVMNLLEAHDIMAVPFKGPVLAQDIYGDLELRQFSDLDILVSDNDAVNAWIIFIKNGFQPQLDLDNNQKYKYVKTEDNISFSKGNIYVELHWEMSGIYLSKPLTLDHVSQELGKIFFVNREISNLCSEQLLVYLCVHGAKHGWGNIGQVCCVAGILKKNLDWDRIEKFALNWKCQKMLKLGLYLSWTLLDAHVSDNVLNEIKKDDTISGLAQEVFACMFKNVTNFKVRDTTDRFTSFHVRIRDSFIDSLRYFFRLAFRPTDKEWLYFPVPGYLSFLHYFLRPCRLLMALVRKQNA
jgi:hypothetical protein